MECKPFATIDEQIKTLQTRGLVIGNVDYARQVLSHVSYYRLSGYTLTLRKDDKFLMGVTFEEIMQIYNFDSEFRAALLYLLEYIEVSFRTHLGYYHSERYGPLGYKNKDNFADENYYNRFIEEVDKQLKESEKREVFVKHYTNKYNGQFPFWLILELISFGCISSCFKNLLEEDKKRICREQYAPIPFNYIENWLQAFVILRNICAHRARLYNKYLTFAPKLSRKDRGLFSANKVNKNNNGKLVFTYIFLMKKLIKNTGIMQDFEDQVEKLVAKYPFVKVSYYGFPYNWREILKLA